MSLLQVRGLEAYYGDFQALFGIDFEVYEGEIVAVIGANGAGKSTFLRSIAGQIAGRSESVIFGGQAMGDWPSHQVVREGIAMVPEGRRLFPSLSVEENLKMGTFAKRSGPWTLSRVYQLFPVLQEKAKVPSTTLSGGQQQMVAIGRALMSNPKLLLCDEISLGLAPSVIKDIYTAVPAICAEGTAVVLVEQDIDMALQASRRYYCFMHGRVSLTGESSLGEKSEISAAYFGTEASAA